jgi:hypothetical protein
MLTGQHSQQIAIYGNTYDLRWYTKYRRPKHLLVLTNSTDKLNTYITTLSTNTNNINNRIIIIILVIVTV